MKLRFYKYHFPFIHTFATSKHTFHARRGVLIQLQKNDITAWGEAAPLPGFSSESLDELLKQIHQYKSDIKNLFQKEFTIHNLDHLFESNHLCPSLQFGLFTITATYLAQQDNLSLHRFLWNHPSDSVALNAVIDLNHITQAEIKRVIRQGFDTLKIKVSENDYFIDRITSLRERHPNIHIRLDANQCWSLKQASRSLQKIEPLGIEYCEEPLRKPSAGSLTKLNSQIRVPVALDESLIHSFNLNQAKSLAEVLIIKPMLLNNISSVNKLNALASNVDQKVILTSSLESGIGRLITASLAAGLAPDAAHGIATGDLLERDVWHDEAFISDGSYTLPSLDELQSLMDIDPEEHALTEISF